MEIAYPVIMITNDGVHNASTSARPRSTRQSQTEPPRVATAHTMSEEWDHIETGEAVEGGVGVRTSQRDGMFQVQFAVHASVTEPKRLRFNCEFLFDTSGSMQGRGIDGIKEILRTVEHVAKTKLTNHKFHGEICTFNKDAQVVEEASAPELLAEWPASKTEAISNRLFASGGTNIDAAIALGSNRMRDFSRKFDASILVLATDGQPTAGTIFDADELRARFEDTRGDLRHYILPLAMGTFPSESFLRTLAAKETFVSVAYDIETVPDALFDGLRLFNEALALFDVSFKVLRDKSLVFETALNKGFVTSRREVVSVELDFAFQPGDVVSVQYPGGEETFTLANDMETREDIWNEIKALEKFEEEVEKIKTKAASMGFKEAAAAVKEFSEALPVHERTRSVNERLIAVHRSLTQASEIPVVKRTIEDVSATIDDTCDEPKYRSVGVDYDSEESTYRSLGACDSEKRRVHPPRGSGLLWEACISQSAF